MSMADEISTKLTALLADAIHKEQVFRRLQTEFEPLCTEYGLDDRDRDQLRKALQTPPSTLEVDLSKFLDELHKQGFPRLTWVGLRRLR
jgi:hypothetical protein